VVVILSGIIQITVFKSCQLNSYFFVIETLSTCLIDSFIELPKPLILEKFDHIHQYHIVLHAT
jgi:hypothetical protein